jgi:hypothetical protein
LPVETRFEPASFTLLPDDDKPRELRIVCANFECEFARRPLPIVAVDEPIYRRLPAFLIAIVDKFASLPWVNALNTVWKVEARKKVGIWQFVRTYLVSLAGVLALGFLLLASLLLSTALSASGKYLSPHLPEATLHIVGSIISFGVITLLFAMMFKWLPDTSVRWRDVWLGAAITAALFEIGKLLISVYIGKQALESTHGAAASLVVLLIWIYYSSQIVLMGAEFRMCVRAFVVPASPAGKNGATGNYEGDRYTVMMMILSPGLPATCVAAGHSKCGATFKLCGDVHVEQQQTLKIPREAGFHPDCGAKRPDEDYRLQSSSVYRPEACGNAAALRSST